MPAPSKENLPKDKLFLVVGIGASAGGLDAFRQLIKNLPVDSGMAYILVQHLDPDHESILAELIQKITLIPVSEVTDNIEIQPNHIYVIPPNKLLTANDGILRLTDRQPKSYHNLPIDLLFKSLAEVYQSESIGVVLSGTGNDGTLGLKVIKQQGGMTFAQDHHSATFREMPQNAINANVVDFVLPPEGIVHQLITINKAFLDPAKNRPKRAGAEDFRFKQILNVLDLKKGVDFTFYKQTTIRRRIARRMVLNNITKLEDYHEYLSTTPTEVDTLLHDILIPVTEFFRDPRAFDNLANVAFPALLKNKKPNDPFRVWTVGCSTGQEAYSVAMLLFEFFSLQNEPRKIQVFATDISESGIIHARSGFYSFADTASLSPERLEKFFIKSEKGYQINKTIRDMCVFANHNILTNPPFAGIDLVTCRNVLIYMDTFLQRKAMATFHYALNEKGMLFLGKSESVGNSSDLFGTSNETDKLYVRNSIPGRFVHIAVKRKTEFVSTDGYKLQEAQNNDDFQKSANDIILTQAPAGVIVNDHFEIVQFRGTTDEWLAAPSGKPSLNIFKMARQGLALDLRNCIGKAKKSREPFAKKGIILNVNGVKKVVTIEVTPILNTINQYYLVQFKNSFHLPAEKNSRKSNGNNETNQQEVRAMLLEKELSQTRADMRTITEDQEAGNEELLSANEELLSGSEELRSLNEELEISKEELQSTVEELSVANQELSFRNDEATYARKYAEAIISTINEPLVVLNQDFQVKSCNHAFCKYFNLLEKEVIGKDFFDVDDGQWRNPALKEMLGNTTQGNSDNVPYEFRNKFRRLGERVMNINARKILNESNSEQLILLVIQDITERKNHEQLIQAKAEYARLVLDSSPIITCTSGPDGIITYANKFFLEYSGLTLEETLTLGWSIIIHPDQMEEMTNEWEAALKSEKDFNQQILLKRHDGAYRWHHAYALPIRDNSGSVTSWVCSSTDIHEQKMFSDELERQIRERTQSLKDSNVELEHSNKNLEQFAFIASHDLQEPLRKIKTFASILLQNYIDNLPNEGKVLIEKINGSAERMSALIQDVLNFSQIRNSEHNFAKADLNDILKKVIGDFALLIEEKNAQIRTGPLPSFEVVALQINQLFYNLLSNALKFAKAEVPPVITITSRTLTLVEVLKYAELNHSLSYCEILFSDNGIGFDDRYKEKIFEMFQRLHRRQDYSGTGIGLALCKRIVVNHGGVIFGESRKGAGTLFHIILPLNLHHPAIDLLPGYVE